MPLFEWYLSTHFHVSAWINCLLFPQPFHFRSLIICLKKNSAIYIIHFQLNNGMELLSFLLLECLAHPLTQFLFWVKQRYDEQQADGLFYQQIKQHSKNEFFWGIPENVIRNEIFCAIGAYCLGAIRRYDFKTDRSTYEILQIPGISLLDRILVKELFTNIDYQDIKELNYNLLEICHI